MKKLAILLLVLFPLNLLAQTSLADIRRKSHVTHVYRVSAKDALDYHKKDSIPVDRFLGQQPYQVFPADSVKEEILPIGFYVMITAEKSDIVASLYNKTNVMAIAINNKRKLQLDIRQRNGMAVENAEVYINNKKARFNKGSRTFWMQQNRLEEASVIILSPGDTCITEITAQDDLRQTIKEQRRQNFRYSKLYKVIDFVPGRLRQLFSKRMQYARTGATGYMVFNKPKYKPLDTVLFKAYLLNKKRKQYNKPVNVFLSYYSRGSYKRVFLKRMKPISSGAYADKFVLGDSIPSDIQCTLGFFTKKDRLLSSRNFSIEEYVLDEIGQQYFKKDKEIYYRNDSLVFTAGGKDANGLHLLDAKARLILLAGSVDTFFKDRVFVADTLYDKEVPLNTTADTKFIIPGKDLPAANMKIQARLLFRNSNNELQEKNESLTFRYDFKDLLIQQVDDSLYVQMMDNNVSVPMKGTMSWNYGEDEPIQYPAMLKINPMAETYDFTAETDSFYTYGHFNITDRYYVAMQRMSSGDTLGFVLVNPYKVPVHYTVLNGNNIIATGTGEGETVSWSKKMGNPRQMYTVRWQYYWAGEERQQQDNIALLYKILNAKVDYEEKIFPGQTDSITVSLTDHKGRPAAGVNLTAASYNTQFKNLANLQDPPYLTLYKAKRGIIRDGFDAEEPEEEILRLRYKLAKHKAWLRQLEADTMEYYKIMFPETGMYDAARYLPGAVMPQIAVHITDGGIPQEIYLLYINNELAYYNGVTEKMKYSYAVWPNNVKLGIRLQDKYIEIDSLYIQPNYKHDLSFDISKLPKNSRVTDRDNWWSQQEMYLLESSLFRMRSNYNNNTGWLWGQGRVVKFYRNQPHIAGPFAAGSELTYFNPGNFDISVPFEPGYEYDFSKKVSRLEKKPLFEKKEIKNFLPSFRPDDFVLGDTLLAAPEIKYPLPAPPKTEIAVSDDYYQYQRNNINGKGKLLLMGCRDSLLKFIILQSRTTGAAPVVLPGYRLLNNIEPGNYNILLVNYYAEVLSIDGVEIRSNQLSCVRTGTSRFTAGSQLLERMQREADSIAIAKRIRVKDIDNNIVQEQRRLPDSSIYLIKGGGGVEGTVTDKKGKMSVPYGSVVIKRYGIGVTTDINGRFSLRNIRPGVYTLLFAMVGYESKEVIVEINTGAVQIVNVQLQQNDNDLNEVVVVGYGVAKTKRSVSASVMSVSSESLFNNALQGKVAGVQVNGFWAGRADSIRIRGAAGLGTDGNPLYVIDGIVYETAQNIPPDQILEISMLKATDAAALYGSRASGGVIIITTKAKQNRSEFRDYAFWQPNFFTDEKGQASIKVTYPDNITSWRTFIVGMDKKRRVVKTSFVTQAYRPLQAQLNLPLFLLEGDSAAFIGKAMNHSPESYQATSSFSVNGKEQAAQSFELKPNDAFVQSLPLEAAGDTLNASFSLETITGFRDREERKIPVFEKGLEESTGAFYVLQSDTTVQVTTQPGKGNLYLYAQNNTLDVLLEELEHLHRYPYYCVEQMTSKFRGLAMEKQIRSQLQQPFRNEKKMQGLLAKIQKAQNFDGGWPWWEGGKSDFYISNYIISALLKYRQDPLVETNIRNGLLYLNNKLPYLPKNQLLTALATLNDAGHEMNYVEWLRKMTFDSLSQQQQWQWVKIMQAQKLPYQKQLEQLLAKKTGTMLGGVHWGDNNYLWYGNATATTILAMEVLKKEKGTQELVQAIVQYFLEMKRGGYWSNTVESASILAALLPEILENNPSFNEKASLSVSGDSSFVISEFPYKAKLSAEAVEKLSVKKSGGGMVYFTAYQNWFNTNPVPQSTQFGVQTYFEKNGARLSEINTGEKIKMLVEIKVYKDADYVMISMPIPAGCIFTDKGNVPWSSHKEYYKDRMIVYADRLPKGEYRFEATLEPRYAGKYTVNPVRAALMYYPIFSGNNEMKKITIINP
ncbi:MAG: carboxypeptidase-like regulatory domain-containing protein [Ferruginibacter sp.]